MVFVQGGGGVKSDTLFGVVTWWSLASSAAMFIASMATAFLDHGRARQVRQDAQAFACHAFDAIEKLAAGRPGSDNRADPTNDSPGDRQDASTVAGANEPQPTSVKELRLAAGDLMDGWARCLAGPSLADRLRNASIAALAVAAATAVAGAALT
jgi:hypothetical protein